MFKDIIVLVFAINIVLGDETKKAIIGISKTNQIFLGLIASFSSNNVLKNNEIEMNILIPPNRYGCKQWSNNNNNNNNNKFIAIVERGNCTFFDKTINAQISGASAVIIISYDETIIPMSVNLEDLNKYKLNNNNNLIIPSIIVGKSFKTKLEDIHFRSKVNVSLYNINYFDISMILVALLATFVVFLGAYYSSNKERRDYYNDNNNNNNKSNNNNLEESSQEINSIMAWSFIVIASCGLMILYYFISYLFKFILFIFVIGSVNGLSNIIYDIMELYISYNNNLLFLQKHCIKFSSTNIKLNYVNIISYVISIFISLLWYINRLNNYAWILQNLMCIGLLLVMQRNVKLTNLKISTILLFSAFIYDIFWVFISPLFFSRSVMVEVATYSNDALMKDTLPIVIKFPKINDPFHSPMILGLGDIALPGLLISYLLKYDYNTNKNIKNIKESYFLINLFGYFIGLILTDINLYIMKHGQPALLFLVPCTLGMTLILSYKRGEFYSLWNNKKYHRSYQKLSQIDN